LEGDPNALKADEGALRGDVSKECFLFKLAGKGRDLKFLHEGERVEIGDWKSNNVSVDGREESSHVLDA
jgi:hypothetical protein